MSRHIGTTIVSVSVMGSLIALGGPLLLDLMDHKTMIVTSGSMEPGISAGDAIVMKPAPAAAIRTGDVITFRPLGGTDLVTHRVLGMKEVAGQLHYQTKGDANTTPDANLAPSRGLVGRHAFTLPGFGRVLLAVDSGMGRMALVTPGVLVVMIRQLLALFGGSSRTRPALVPAAESR